MFNLFNKLKRLFFKKQRNKLKLGLALGSGGAKGMAHIGIIRAFEEENIHFDVVSGASIGSIVGGMYAKKFSTDNMIDFISELGLTDTQKLIKYALQGLTVEKILDKMLGGCEFEDLPINFKAVAVDLDNGCEVTLERGNLARAMSASSAVPPFFKPVVIDDKRLVDGAYLNSVPSDVCKRMGADYVVGVNLSSEIPYNNKIKPILDKLYPNNKVAVTNRAYKGETFSNYLLKPDLSAFSTVAYKKLDQMYEIGYKLAKEKMPEIKADLLKYGFDIK